MENQSLTQNKSLTEAEKKKLFPHRGKPLQATPTLTKGERKRLRSQEAAEHREAQRKQEQSRKDKLEAQAKVASDKMVTYHDEQYRTAKKNIRILMWLAIASIILFAAVIIGVMGNLNLSILMAAPAIVLTNFALFYTIPKVERCRGRMEGFGFVMDTFARAHKK